MVELKSLEPKLSHADKVMLQAKEDKRNRELASLTGSENTHIEKCLTSKCENIKEDYQGGNVTYFSCHTHNYRAKVTTVVRSKDYKNARLVELFVNKDK